MRSPDRRDVLSALAALSGLALLAGCSLALVQGNPRPNLALAPTQKTLKLVLAPAVLDVLDVPRQNGIMEAKVTGWHATLTNGFRNGFGDVYKLVDGAAPADLTLTLESVELELVPASVSAQAGVIAIDAHVRFKATLADGARVKRTAATAASKRATVSRFEVTGLADSAIESMYEGIAKELFTEAGGK